MFISRLVLLIITISLDVYSF